MRRQRNSIIKVNKVIADTDSSESTGNRSTNNTKTASVISTAYVKSTTKCVSRASTTAFGQFVLSRTISRIEPEGYSGSFSAFIESCKAFRAAILAAA